MPVEVNPGLYTAAEVEFGTDGRPDCNDFCLGPLAAVMFACETDHVRAQPLTHHPGVFSVLIPASGLFPPVLFSLALLDNGEVWHIYDYVIDHEYWDLVAQDPNS